MTPLALRILVALAILVCVASASEAWTDRFYMRALASKRGRVRKPRRPARPSLRTLERVS